MIHNFTKMETAETFSDRPKSKLRGCRLVMPNPDETVISEEEEECADEPDADKDEDASPNPSSQWRSYPSLHKEKTLVTKIPEDVSYVVTEKIDGSNYAIELLEDGTIQCYSRNMKLGGNVAFMGAEALLPKWEAALGQLKQPTLIYGEIFGHYFPNAKGHIVKDLSKKKKAIQTRLCYSPNIEFVAFDVKRNRSFLPFFEAQALCTRIGIRFIDPIFTGTKLECLEWAKTHVETYRTGYQQKGAEGTRFHAPIAEGFVIRDLGTEHFLLKMRAEGFWETIKPRSRKPKDGEKDVESFREYVTDARLHTLHSKMLGVSELSRETASDWITRYTEDVMQDMMEDGHERPDATLVRKAAGQLIWNVIRGKV
jgi:hypothetical protein